MAKSCTSCKGPLVQIKRGGKDGREEWYCEAEKIVLDSTGDGTPSDLGDRVAALEKKFAPVDLLVGRFTGKKLEELTEADLPKKEQLGFLADLAKSMGIKL